MKSSLLYVSLAVFCCTQLFIPAVVGLGLPVESLQSVVGAGTKLVKCVVENGIAKVLPGAEGTTDLIAQAGGTVNPLSTVTNLLGGLPLLGSILTGALGPFLSIITGVVGGVIPTVTGTLYCVVGPDGLISSVLNAVGQLLSGITNVVPLPLPGVGK